MDQLKNYKDLWNKQEISEQWDQSELYKMMHKSSSSLVKWIFYVSLIEFAFFLLLNLVVKTDWDSYKELGLYNFIYGVNIAGYVILIVFIYLFYRNYKRIHTTQSVKELMRSILLTRKTVRIYILINLAAVTIAFIYSFYIILQEPEYEVLIEKFGLFVIWLIVLFAIVFIVSIIYLIYLLIYGYFIRKLKRNYKELSDEISDH